MNIPEDFHSRGEQGGAAGGLRALLESGWSFSQLSAQTKGSASDSAPPPLSSACAASAAASHRARTRGSGAESGATRWERRAGEASWHCGRLRGFGEV